MLPGLNASKNSPSGFGLGVDTITIFALVVCVPMTALNMFWLTPFASSIKNNKWSAWNPSRFSGRLLLIPIAPQFSLILIFVVWNSIMSSSIVPLHLLCISAQVTSCTCLNVGAVVIALLLYLVVMNHGTSMLQS